MRIATRTDGSSVPQLLKNELDALRKCRSVMLAVSRNVDDNEAVTEIVTALQAFEENLDEDRNYVPTVTNDESEQTEVTETVTA